MTYLSDSLVLRSRFDLSCDRIEFPSRRMIIVNEWFESAAWTLLPGLSHYRCAEHSCCFDDNAQEAGDEYGARSLSIKDGAVDENRRFRYATFVDSRQTCSRGVILLLHGLNERDWAKYLPWAARLVESTGKAVMMFPIAFHMNRAPSEWRRPRPMRAVSAKRQAASCSIANSSFANAAISTRLGSLPERFCWSGLQTLHDVAQLVDDIRRGKFEHISPDASVDLFAYSIGAFLAEILMMADPAGLFADTKLFMFCGGATLDRMNPNSRYILDSDATIALYSFFLARFDNELRKNARLEHYVNGAHSEGQYFRAMVNYQEGKVHREPRLRQVGSRIAAFALRSDRVVPANEVIGTLQGNDRDIPIQVEVADFPYEYSHMTPFPINGPASEVERCFDHLFSAAATHFCVTHA